jgi:hypothetical protein
MKDFSFLVIAFLISLRYNYDNSKGAVNYEWQ